jgi:urea transport system substrate-binding protein
MQQVRPTTVLAGALLLNTAMAERHRGRQQNFIDLGESPLEQLAPSIPRIMTDSDVVSWYLVGNDYVWPRTLCRLAAQLIAQGGGRVHGTRFAPIGSGDYDAILDGIERSGSDVVLSCFFGENAIRFERNFHARGLRRSIRTLATNFDDSLLDHVGIPAASGLWASSDHAADLARDTETGARYTRRFGIASPPLTGLARAAYDGVHLFGRAADETRSLDPDTLARHIRTGSVGSSVIRRRVQGIFTPASVATVTSHGFQPIS